MENFDHSQDTIDVKHILNESPFQPKAEDALITDDSNTIAPSNDYSFQSNTENQMTQTIPQTGRTGTQRPRAGHYLPKDHGNITPEDLDNATLDENESEKDRKRKIMIVSICAGVLAFLIVLISIIIIASGGDSEDPNDSNGLIHKNVFVAGIDLGGKTLEQAKNLLHLKTDHTFSQKDMVVKLPGSSINLSPDKTGAALDVDAVAKAAYQCGREGAASKDGTYNIALLPYLTLNQEYIQDTISEFCETHSSVMSAPTATLEGSRPEFDPENPDKEVRHQVLRITLGTPDFALNDNDLYEQVLDAYSMNQLIVEYEAPALTEPEGVDVMALYEQYCTPPQDAIINPATYEITPEIYGYGFEPSQLQQIVDQAYYGETVEITFKYLIPSVVSSDFSKDMFVDSLSQYQISSNLEDSKRNNNISLSCKALNEYVVNAGDTFSFNEVIGKISTRNGYSTAPISELNGSVMGGGISQTASALYICALIADLDIIERHSHEYSIDFCELGLDAMVDGSTKDLRFRNNTTAPIRILAEADDGKVNIEIVGINELAYEVELLPRIVAELKPLTSYQNMTPDNSSGYADGDILQNGITGYKVELHIEKYNLETGVRLSSEKISTSEYAKVDEVVAHIPPVVTEPTIPNNTTTTDPADVTTPTESTETTDTTEPTESLNAQLPFAA